MKISELTANVFTNGYTTVSTRSEMNFEVLCREWFDLFIAPGLASVTEEHRRMMLKNHVFASFGTLDIENVDLPRLQRFFNAKVKAGLSADYVGKMRNLVNKFFKYAVDQHFIRDNPMKGVVLRKQPTIGEKSSRALRPEIRENIFEWVTENPVLKPIVFTFTLTGMRPQELIALVWENVNLDSKTKTPKSVRTILLPDAAVDALREWQEYCKQNGISSDFVFPCTKIGRMRTYSGLRSMLERFKNRHDLQNENLTLYTFRHTFATILLEQRENPKIVSELMGHTRVSTTLDLYSTVYSTVYEQTAQTLNGAFVNLIQKNPPDHSVV